MGNQSLAGAICVGMGLLISASAQAQNLFEADSGTGNIYEFTPDGTKSTFVSGLGLIAGMAFNNVGNLFVANGGVITEITPNGVQSTFASGVMFTLLNPLPMAFNSAGDLFVANGLDSDIIEIKPDGTQTIFASELGGPFGLAFNSAGDLFAACGSSSPNTSGKIFEFAPNGSESTFASGLTDPSALTFNRAGDLFVGNYTSGIINEITPNGVQSVFASGLPDAPLSMACDSAGDLFVATAGNGEGSAAIYEFSPNGLRSTFVPSGLDAPVALAFQPVPEPSVLGLQAISLSALFIGLRVVLEKRRQKF